MRASVYLSAIERHLHKFKNGEWSDPTTGVPHLSSIIACAGIIADANLAGKLVDDRPPSIAIGSFIDAIEKDVRRISTLFADRNPQHFTIQD